MSSVDALGFNPLAPPSLTVTVTGDAALDVREFVVHEALGELFVVELVCVSFDHDIDFDALIGEPASFRISRPGSGQSRVFSGVVRAARQLVSEPQGLSTYTLTIVPALWLLTQNRTYRIFQDTTDPDIALAIFSRWGLAPDARLTESYKPRRYRVQYAESDFAFASRLLQDAGVTFFFDTGESGGGAFMLSDAPEKSEARAPLPFVATPTQALRQDFVTRLRFTRTVAPGAYTQEDVDFRRPPSFPVRASSKGGLAVESALEVYHYNPGALLFAGGGGDGTPTADDRGAQRTDLAEGGRQTEKRLAAKRGSARRCAFGTSALDVRPGSIVSFTDHPRAEFGSGQSFLVVSSHMHGSSNDAFLHTCEAQPTTARFRPPLATPKPKARGVESATVVGPGGAEIYSDEFGRVRVHFHWDREGSADESASCWIPVNQPWGGTSFGALNIPRIGQEVLVDFLSGDPDRPVIMGRVFTQTNPPPYELPGFKDLQTIRSESTPKLPTGTARSGMINGKTTGGGDGSGTAGPQSSPLGGGMPFSLDKIASLVGSSRLFQASSPDGSTHGWQGSELGMLDPQGNELLYMQAQKDFHKVVKNNQISVIGHAKSETIGSDNIRYVGNKEGFNVGADRTGSVSGEQLEVFQQASLKQSITAGQQWETRDAYVARSKDVRFDATETWGSEAPVHVIVSKDILKLVTEGSQIVMKPDGMVIQGDVTHLNPGSDFVAAALRGHSLNLAQLASEAQQKREDARKKAQAEAEAFDKATEDTQHRPQETGSNRRTDMNHRMAWGRRMREAGYEPNIDTYNSLVNGTHTVPDATPTTVGPSVGI